MPSDRHHDVVMFVRSLSRRAAGGTRSVLQRANAYARTGHRVHLVVLGEVREAGLVFLRRQGTLDERVRVLPFARYAPDAADRSAAADAVPLDPPRPVGPEDRVERVLDGDRCTVRCYRDGRTRWQEVVDRQGRTVSYAGYDPADPQRWRYAAPGTVEMIDHLSAEDGPVGTRDYVLDGRYVWLSADVATPVGRGRATRPGRPGWSGTLADALAQWLDRELSSLAQVVVMADGENAWQDTLRAMRHPGLVGVSVLHNSHLDEPYDAGAPTKARWEPFFTDLRNVDAMVCLTGRQREHLRSRYPGLPLRVLHHAVPAPSLVTVPRDPRRVVFVGRYAPQKRLADLVRAWAQVAEQVPDARLELHGDGGERAMVEELVESLDLTGSVQLAGFTQDPLEVFASARVAVMSSWYEGLPLTLTEAMGVGTPFVAYDVNYGPAEVIQDGVNGRLVTPGDVAGLARALVEVLTDDALAARLSDAARRVTDDFSPARFDEQWQALLDDLVPTPRTTTEEAR